MTSKLNGTLSALGAAIAIACTAPVLADGNRYDYERFYRAEISVSEAYLEMEASKGHSKHHKHRDRPVLVDVRTLREYASGHPEDAYNIPYPNIYGGGDQDPYTFYQEVRELVRGRMDTPIMLLCRTGSRSVRAGNILANPDSDPATAGLEPFTNVFNIWQGFVGQPLYAFNGGTIKLDLDDEGKLVGGPYQLDLNNDGVINADTADVHVETKDANPDKDGWRNSAGLPWTTGIRRPQSYLQDPWLYKALNLTPVE